MEASAPLQLYRFAIEDLYRQQEYVLDESGERLMSLSSRLAAAPNDAYWALSTADAKFPTVTLSDGEAVTVSYGQYRAILATRRNQTDRALAFNALHETYKAALNTYASLYNGVCQRDWFQARARGYKTTLDAALHGDNIPTSVVENLIETTKAGVEPLRRYHRLRRKALGVPTYQVYDFSIPLVTFDKKILKIEIPSSVLDLVKARVSSLSEQERDLLDTASCCGFLFDPLLVAEATVGHADESTVRLLVHALRGGAGDPRQVRFENERILGLVEIQRWLPAPDLAANPPRTIDYIRK